MIHHLIPRIVAKLMIPFLLLFGFYVQFHGDFGPGGGFQAGVIVAAAFILYALVYGLENTQRALPAPVMTALMAGGLFLYIGTGFVTTFLGGEFLNYSVLSAKSEIAGQHLGILVIEFGVGMTVAAVMIAIFKQFAARLHVSFDQELEDRGILEKADEDT